MVNKVGGAASLQAPPAATTPLMFAAQSGDEEMMKVLVAAGAKTDFVTADKIDLAMAAAGSGKLNVVKYAVSLHPKLDGVKEDGSSVMHLALARVTPETPEILKYLADQGAPLNIRNRRGQTPAEAAQRAAPAIREAMADIVKAHPQPTAEAAAASAPAAAAAPRAAPGRVARN